MQPLDRVTAGRVLYVDDESSNLDLFRLEFEETYTIHCARNGVEALAILAKETIDVLLTDERMPGMRGIDLLARIHESNPEISRVIVSAYGDADRLLLAMNRGHAHEYVLKPWHRDELGACIERCLATSQRWQSLARQAGLVEVLTADDRLNRSPTGLVGANGSLASLVTLAERAAKSSAPVLVTGETGTGKEVFASLIHERSERAAGPFVRVNCSSLAEGLLESELFGHEQGSFTGAIRAHKGRFEVADGGTIFLDEIGDISPRMQTNLLRVLQESSFERVGGTKSIKVDVRVVAATHRNLSTEVTLGRFRQDLFYRLNVIPIHVPPLRDRKEEVADLVDHFLRKHSGQGRGRRLSKEALVALTAYDWPGNVRELENVVRRALALGIDEELLVEDFCLQLSAKSTASCTSTQPRDEVREGESRQLHHLIVSHGGNLARAARTLGIPRTTLASRASKLGLI